MRNSMKISSFFSSRTTLTLAFLVPHSNAPGYRESFPQEDLSQSILDAAATLISKGSSFAVGPSLSSKHT